MSQIGPSADVHRARRLSTPEAAEYVGLKPKTLEAYRRTGEGPVFISPGGSTRRVVYDTGDLDEWLARGRRRSTADNPESFAA